MLQDLFLQAKRIELLNTRLEDVLRSKKLIEFYVRDRLEHPEEPLLANLLSQAKQLKSYAIVAYGLKEFVDDILANLYPGQGIQSILLESKEELENRAIDWLSVGDVITGFSGVTCDARGPRVITAEQEHCYEWRYLAEPEMQSRAPHIDPFFRRRDWVRCSVKTTEVEEQLLEVSLMQEEEIEALANLWEFLNSGEFQVQGGE